MTIPPAININNLLILHTVSNLTSMITIYINTHTVTAPTDRVTADPLLPMGGDTREGTVPYTSRWCLRKGSILLRVGISHWWWASILSRPGTQQRQSPFILSSSLISGVIHWCLWSSLWRNLFKTDLVTEQVIFGLGIPWDAPLDSVSFILSWFHQLLSRKLCFSALSSAYSL